MATIQPATATITVLATATQTILGPTVTVTTAASPTWLNSRSGTLCYVNIVLVLTSLLVIAVLGSFNRLSAIPLVATVSMTIGCGMDWYGWNTADMYSAHARRAAVIVSNVFFLIQMLAVSLYSFFLLQSVLIGFQRRLFLSVYIFLFLCLIGLESAAIAITDRYFTESSEIALAAVGRLVNKLIQSSLVFLSALEMWSAFFLIRTFYKASKNAAATGRSSAVMWTGLLRSTELRVSLLAIIALVRLICFRSYNTPVILNEIDSFAWIMLHCYPVILQLDLIAAKMLSFKKVAMSRCGPEMPGGNAVAPVITAQRILDPDGMSAEKEPSLARSKSKDSSGKHQRAVVGVDEETPDGDSV